MPTVETGNTIKVFDNVVSEDSITEEGLIPWPDVGFEDSDAVLILNNHPNNSSINLVKSLRQNSPRLFFDGFGIFDQNEVMNVKAVTFWY